MSTSSESTFLSLSASERCRDGVPAAALATLPVGLPRRVSAGERHQPVTCSALWRPRGHFYLMPTELDLCSWCDLDHSTRRHRMRATYMRVRSRVKSSTNFTYRKVGVLWPNERWRWSVWKAHINGSPTQLSTWNSQNLNNHFRNTSKSKMDFIKFHIRSWVRHPLVIKTVKWKTLEREWSVTTKHVVIPRKFNTIKKLGTD